MTQLRSHRKNDYAFTLFKHSFESRKNLRMLEFLFGIYLLLYEFNFATMLRSRHLIRKLKVKHGERIFEAGCGMGTECLRIAAKHALVVGGDIDSRFKYSTCLGNSKLLKVTDFIVMDLCYIPIRSQAFNKITCSEVLEHISNDGQAVSEFSRILKIGGRLLVHVPNLMRFSRGKKIAKNKSRLLARSEYRHVRDGYTVNQLSDLFIKNDFQVCNYMYTFGLWSRFASRIRHFSSALRSEILFFPFYFLMALLDSRSKTDKYSGGILIVGEKN